MLESGLQKMLRVTLANRPLRSGLELGRREGSRIQRRSCMNDQCRVGQSPKKGGGGGGLDLLSPFQISARTTTPKGQKIPQCVFMSFAKEEAETAKNIHNPKVQDSKEHTRRSRNSASTSA